MFKSRKDGVVAKGYIDGGGRMAQKLERKGKGKELCAEKLVREETLRERINKTTDRSACL